MKTKIVVGLGFGDEGKGIATDYLCRQSQNPLVVRFSGGHQAGHTVVTEEGKRHVFSSFGSGTLQGAATYWSRFCTLYPLGFWNEATALQELGFSPLIYVDALAMVTTPYDVFHNRITERKNAHGSCGLGFGATVERNETPYKLYVQDLFYPIVSKQKLNAIAEYYRRKNNYDYADEEFLYTLEIFQRAIAAIMPMIRLVQEKEFFASILQQQLYDTLIFEGSQGILLDMDHGFFPNVTRCHTTSRNALHLIANNSLPQAEIYYVTRAYQTRHGNGFLSNENLELRTCRNPRETNQYNDWQGQQRQSVLDIDMLNYALQCDRNYSGNTPKNLVITCMDQLLHPLQATQKGRLREFFDTLELASALDVPFNQLIESHSDCAVDMVVRQEAVV